MYCRNCGTKLDDNARFCFGCGTQIRGSAPAGSPAAQPRHEKPVSPKKPPKKKKDLVAIVAIVAVVVVVAAVLAFSGLFGNDSVKVAAALTKSYKAFSDAVDQMELTDISSLAESKKVSEEFSLWIDEIDGSSAMKGMGIRLSVDSNLPERNVGMSVTPFFGSANLLSVQMKLDDSEIYVGSPDLTGGKFYMVNTTTLCNDLENLGADLGDAAGISFNIFDLIEKAQELNADREELSKAITKAATELFQEVEVEKTGSETIDVNGKDLKCTAYDVVIDEIAIHKFLTTVDEACRNAQNPDAYIQLLESIGLPAEVTADMKYALEDSSYGITEAFSDIHLAVEQLGDIKLTLYLNDGYVVAAVYENNFSGVDVSVILNIGDGRTYLDHITLQLIADNESYQIVSTGNHSGAGDVFTDVTTLKYEYNGVENTLAEIDSFYAPKQSNDNFHMKLNAGSAFLELRGQLTCKKNALSLHLNNISVSEYDEKLAVLGMELIIGEYVGDSFSVKNYEAFADMTLIDLMGAVEEVGKYANDWAMNLDSDLQNALSDIAYDLF